MKPRECKCLKKMKKRLVPLLALCLGLSAPAGAHVWDELAIMARPDGQGGFTLEKYCFIQPATYTNSVFFDYDNDGNPDMLLVGEGGDWNISSSEKFVLLYHNLGPGGDYRFEKVTDTGLKQSRDEGFYNPVSVGDVNHDGYNDILIMNYDAGRKVELYLNDRGTGRFLLQETGFEGASNGSVMFGDFDGDGWLDIEYSGYSDTSATCMKIYRNRHDGTFEDATPGNVFGAFQGQSSLADINGDGWLDIISCGNGNDWVCLSSLFYSLGDGNPLAFEYIGEGDSGILGASRANPLVADFNADGKMDIIVNGEPSDGSGFRNRIYYQDGDGKFRLDTSYPIVPVNQDGGINMGDWNGDGNMDVIAGGYVGTYDTTPDEYYASPLRVYENSPESCGLRGNTIPEAPGRVTAGIEGDTITVAWTPGSDTETAETALRYNIFVRNETTGETFSLIPVDIETGKLKVGTDLQVSLSSKTSSYSMSALGDGEYTVGVQTLDQSYAGSPFSTCKLQAVGTGADGPDVCRLRIVPDSGGVVVKGETGQRVRIFNTEGQIIAIGTTNERILLPGHGLFIVNSGGITSKILM